MGKGKSSRRRKDLSTESGESEREIERQTQEKGELVPPSGPSPRPLPERQRPRPARQSARAAVSDIIEAIRLAAGALLDLADAAADAVRRQIERA